MEADRGKRTRKTLPSFLKALNEVEKNKKISGKRRSSQASEEKGIHPSPRTDE